MHAAIMPAHTQSRAPQVTSKLLTRTLRALLPTITRFTLRFRPLFCPLRRRACLFRRECTTPTPSGTCSRAFPIACQLRFLPRGAIRTRVPIKCLARVRIHTLNPLRHLRAAVYTHDAQVSRVRGRSTWRGTCDGRPFGWFCGRRAKTHFW